MGESPIQKAGPQRSPVVSTSSAGSRLGTSDTRASFHLSHEAWEGGDCNYHPTYGETEAERHAILAWGTPVMTQTPHSQYPAALTPKGIMSSVSRKAHYPTFCPQHPSPASRLSLSSRQLSWPSEPGRCPPLSQHSMSPSCNCFLARLHQPELLQGRALVLLNTHRMDKCQDMELRLPDPAVCCSQTHGHPTSTAGPLQAALTLVRGFPCLERPVHQQGTASGWPPRPSTRQPFTGAERQARSLLSARTRPLLHTALMGARPASKSLARINS